MAGARPLRQSTYKRDFKWHCPEKESSRAKQKDEPQCKSCCPSASVGPAPTSVDYCLCNQTNAYMRKLNKQYPLLDNDSLRNPSDGLPSRIKQDTMTTTYQPEVSARAGPLESAYASMQRCHVTDHMEMQLAQPPAVCLQPQLDWSAFVEKAPCAGDPPAAAAAAPRELQQLPVPSCRQHLPMRPSFTAPPTPCDALRRRRCRGCPPPGATFRVLLGVGQPASSMYALGYSEYADTIGGLGEKILKFNKTSLSNCCKW